MVLHKINCLIELKNTTIRHTDENKKAAKYEEQKRFIICDLWNKASYYRTQGHFGPPVLHVPKSFQERTKTQYALL